MAKQAPTIQIPMGLKPYEADNLRALANGLKDIANLDNKLNSSATIADGKIKIDSADGVPDYIEDKIKAGSGITLTEGNVGQRGGKTLTIAIGAHADLTDMPDTTGVVTDHDIRYVTKVQTAEPTVPTPFVGQWWYDTDVDDGDRYNNDICMETGDSLLTEVGYYMVL
jgi:hypothetical protein